MRYTIIFISLVFLFSCKKEHKKETQNDFQKIEEATKTKDSLSNNAIVNNKKHYVDELHQSKLDYSLKIEEVKNQKDSMIFLKHYFNQFVKEKDSLSEVLFFKMFPDNFKEFKTIYGYEENQDATVTVYGGLYDNYEQIIDYKPIFINTQVYIERLIDISVKGVWQSDNVAHIQNKVNKLFFQKNDLFVEILKKKDISEIESFWKFFFDGPHPENQQELYNRVLSNLAEYNEVMIPVVMRAYKKAKESRKEY